MYYKKNEQQLSESSYKSAKTSLTEIEGYVISKDDTLASSTTIAIF